MSDTTITIRTDTQLWHQIASLVHEANIHRRALPNPWVAPASDALPRQADRLVTVPLVGPFAPANGLLGLPRLLRSLLTSRAGSCPSPFQA
jgi:hypothetical protein